MRTVKRKLPDAWDDPEDEIVLRRILAESLLEDQVRQAAFAAKTSKLFKTESGTSHLFCHFTVRADAENDIAIP